MIKEKKQRFNILTNFLKTEQAAGIILIVCAIVSLLLSNSKLQNLYLGFWHEHISIRGLGFSLDLSIEEWINDGLMVLFFLLVGLEIKRELLIGHLSSVKKASLPIMAALGGMIIPACIYAFVNKSSIDSMHGWGVPMATDIAFALGVLSLLGKRVTLTAKTFLMALAVIDDLGAILVIALFYSSGLVWSNLCIALLLFGVLIALNLLKVYKISLYMIIGGFMWYFLLKSGIHATIAGVLIALTIPLQSNFKDYSPLQSLEHGLHDIAGFLVMPLFALANTALILESSMLTELKNPLTLGIIAGLCLGKPIGIFLFTYLSVRIKLSRLPDNLTLRNIIGIGCLAGIGFTMSMLISMLAFDQESLKTEAKIAVLIASLLSAIIGYLVMRIKPKAGAK